MAKKSISSTDLIWIFHEKLRQTDACPGSGPSIAIVPTPDVGWTAVMNAGEQAKHPLWAKQVRAIEKQLREKYVLKG